MNDIFCFVHIERAGGTSLHHLLKRNSPFSYFTISPRTGAPSKNGFELKPHQVKKILSYLPFTKGLGGHSIRPYLGYEDYCKVSIKYFTFLRDPISRYLSHLNYHINRLGINWGLEEFLKREEFKNFQTVRLAGEANFNKAKEILLQKFAFVGLTENYDESLLLLNQTLNLNLGLQYKIRNKLSGNNKFIWNKLSYRMQEMVYINNEIDIMLYNFTKENIYDKIKVSYAGNLIDDLNQLKKQNMNYSESILNVKFLKFIKGISRYIIEPILLSKQIDQK